MESTALMIISTRLLVFLALLSSAAATLARAEDCGETVLYNGKIATMDQHDTMASSITIKGDRIVAVGTSPGIPKRDSCATLIDLKGRRAIPGLIDSHNHIVVVSLRPGRDVRLDITSSIDEVKQLLHQ